MPCTLPTVATTGKGVASFDEDDCAVVLQDPGIPQTDDSGDTTMRDGSAPSPISLPNMEKLTADASFPYLVVGNDAGELKFLPANTGGEAEPSGDTKVLQAFGSAFSVAIGNIPCFGLDQVCLCPYDFLAGFKLVGEEPNQSLCLVRLAPTPSALLGGVTLGPNSSIAFGLVSALPPLGGGFEQVGQMRMVTDASNPVLGEIVVGTGIVKCIVFSDGEHWRVV